MSATQIAPKFVPKIWGSTHLEPWFANPGERIGEVWFPAGDLLIKFLFTTEHLSVQVHPDDEYAAKHENSRGKTEMWYILRADPGAQVALGFKTALTAEEFEEGIRTGAVMDQLAWHDARPGDTFFTPAGTVHAIGAGLALCEIQQNSDVTYRIFDYGRPRDLHIERSLDVSTYDSHPGAAKTGTIAHGHEELVRCDHFATEKLLLNESRVIPGTGFAVVLEGEGSIDGQMFRSGTVWELGGSESRLDGNAVLLLTRAS